MDLPTCPKCKAAIMIPLSDYGPDGAMVPFKAWACLDPQCRNSLFCDKGKVCYGIKSPNHNER